MEFYRRDGSTFEDPLEFARMLADYEYRKVARTVGEGWCVSTVFLVTDHGWGLTPYPMLYETYLSAGELEHIERYPNEIAALAGHDQWVAKMRDLTTADREASSEESP